MKEIDYVEFYAKKLKEDNSFFAQQKSLIDSQLKSSISVFKNTFGTGEDFKKNARNYLRKIGIL